MVISNNKTNSIKNGNKIPPNKSSSENWEFSYQAKNLLFEYLKSTSINGYKMLLPENSTPASRIFWVILMFGTILFTTFFVTGLYIDYLHSPTSTDTQNKPLPANRVPMPAIGFCSLNIISKARLLKLAEKIFEFQKHVNSSNTLGDTIEEIAKELLILGKLLDLEYDSRQLPSIEKVHKLFQEMYRGEYYPLLDILLNISVPCEELVVHCLFEGNPFNCSERFVTRLTGVGYCCMFNYQRPSRSDFRKLYLEKLKYPDEKPLYFTNSGPSSVLTAVINLNISDFAYNILSLVETKIIITEPMSYPDSFVGLYYENYIPHNVEINFALYPKIVQSDPNIGNFAPDVRKCYTGEEGGLAIKGNFYSMNECLLRHILIEIFQSCGCIFIKMPNFFSKTLYCSLIDLPCLSQWRNLWTERTHSSSETLSFEKCYTSCSYIRYKATKTWKIFSNVSNGTAVARLYDLKPGNYSVVNVYFGQKTFEVHNQYINNNWTSLLSRFGGICSIMFGGSIISLVEVVYYLMGKFLVIWYRCAVNFIQGKRMKKQEKDTVKKKDIYWNEITLLDHH